MQAYLFSQSYSCTDFRERMRSKPYLLKICSPDYKPQARSNSGAIDVTARTGWGSVLEISRRLCLHLRNSHAAHLGSNATFVRISNITGSPRIMPMGDHQGTISLLLIILTCGIGMANRSVAQRTSLPRSHPTLAPPC